jgi:sugar phosphate isomerase/epimerase
MEISMKYAQMLKKGTSSCFFRELTCENFKMLKSVGIDCVEISTSFDNYMTKWDFPANCVKIAEDARAAGIELWSIHLPFSRVYDISNLNDDERNLIIKTNMKLIEAASMAGVRIAVLHPSSEPITDDIRQERLSRSREAIIMLNEQCKKYNMQLAIENLPRTCLCNRSDEMINLLRGTGASIVFDTNHSLGEDNLDFLDSLISSGIKIVSLHISDYDGVDERHRLPGDGINKWQQILTKLKKAEYRGPLMYEVSKKPKEREEIMLNTLAINMQKLANAEIE